MISGLGRSSREENGNPLQNSFLENCTDRGAWQATVHRVAKSPTRLSDFTHSLHMGIDKYFGMFLTPPSLIGKDSDAERDWGQEEKGTTEDEMAGWHH